MAEEEGQEQSQPQPPQEALAAGGPPVLEQQKGKGLMIIIILVIVVLLLAGAGTAVYFMFFTTKQRDVIVVNPDEEKFIELYNQRKQDSIEAIKPDTAPVFSDVYAYTVNMKNGKHMMKLSFKCEMYDETAIEFLKLHKPEIDDAMINRLKRLGPEDLRNRAGLDLLKEDILRIMNSFFSQQFIDMSKTKDRNPVKAILIVEYYID